MFSLSDVLALCRVLRQNSAVCLYKKDAGVCLPVELVTIRTDVIQMKGNPSLGLPRHTGGASLSGLTATSTLS